jgi:hypothetical protein
MESKFFDRIVFDILMLIKISISLLDENKSKKEISLWFHRVELWQ